MDLKEERKQTDDSLSSERDKTNESIAKATDATELLTDKAVIKERSEFDEKTSQSITVSDKKAIKQERVNIDAALEKERSTKSEQAEQLLGRERDLTDESLSSERNTTDLEAKQSLELLSKTQHELTTRDEFLAIVSHDLRNPIGTASSYATVLLTEYEMDAEIKEGVEVIKRNMDTSLRLISDLLDVERISHGKLNLNLEPHNIGKIVQEIVENFKGNALSKSILLHSLGTFDVVMCDRDRIMQVLSNLVGNALKFTPEGGAITISSKVSETEIQVSVQDTGPGIPEAMRQQIFKRFAQLNSSDRRGLGLGLYISKTIIELHHGSLWVDSELGAGSTFNFAIPNKSENK